MYDSFLKIEIKGGIGKLVDFTYNRFTGRCAKKFEESNKIITRANALTFLGIVAVGVRVLLFTTGKCTGAIPFLRIFTAFTDVFDGWLAERYDERTVLGKVMDPFRDRLDAVATLLNVWLLFGFDAMGLIVAVLVFEGSILLSGAWLLARKNKVGEVHGIGKWRMAIHQIASFTIEVQVYWLGYIVFDYAIIPLACMVIMSGCAMISYMISHRRDLIS